MDGPRIAREKKTVAYMIRFYCERHHSDLEHKEGLCDSCAELQQYAHKRLSHCQFGETKTTCGKCPIHCYKPDKRERIKEVMRYSGPRMVYRRPVLAFQHLLDGLKKPRTSR